MGHQLGEGPGRFHNAVRMLVEHLEEIAVSRHQFSKQHEALLVLTQSAKQPVDNGMKCNRHAFCQRRIRHHGR
jgi:hypothetical protein